MPIDPVGLNDTQAIAKVNAAIDQANKVDAKADQSAVDYAFAMEALEREAAASLLASKFAAGDLSRPGEAEIFWTHQVEGEPGAVSPVSPDLVAIDSDGAVLRVSGSAFIGPTRVYRCEPGRIYRVRFVVRRRQNPADPANHTVRLALRWLARGKGALKESMSVVGDLNDFLVADGRTEISAIAARAVGQGIDIVAPAGAVYFRPFVQTYGNDGVTDIEAVDVVDVTNAIAVPSDVSQFESRMQALESADAPLRLNEIEAQIGGAQLRDYLTRGAVEAATISETVDAIRVIQYDLMSAPAPTVYARAAIEPAHEFKLQSEDGAWWALSMDQVSSANFGGNVQAAGAYGRNRTLFVGPGETVDVAASGWADVNAKLTEMSRWLIAKGGLVRIVLASGVYASNVSVKIDHPYADRIALQSAEADISYALTGLAGVTSVGAGNHAVKFSVADPTGLAVGRFVRISKTVGTGDHIALRGYHEVTALAGNQVTVKVCDKRTVLPAMTLTSASIVMHPCEVHFSNIVVPDGQDFYALELLTNAAIGAFGGIGLIGDVSITATSGIRVGDAAVFVGIPERVSVANWGRNGIWSFRNAMTYADTAVASNCVTAAFNSIQSAQAELIRSIASGSGVGFSAANAARNSASQGTATGNTINCSASDYGLNLISAGSVWGASSIGLRATQNGYNVAASTAFGECLTAVRAQSGGRNYVTTPTFTNCPTTFNPPLNQLGVEAALNHDGTSTALMLTELRVGSGGAKLSKILLATSTFTLGQVLADADSAETQVAVPGAVIGDEVSVETTAGGKVANTDIKGKVTATDVVSIWAHNSSPTAPVTITARTYRITVRRTDP
ncbi:MULTISPECIES: hypothetical protein [unclassified Rhizobium]|uniref:hypothetical protein n=1 Tax=unclassified Rhizobium TaxID=2613769 RepID=UPI001AE21FF2|nr:MULTISPECIES: hypothetical protein [unclassified Rhizobium]MBP2459577.1 stage V sporulation protein SpoVS [Rhizobium sp. PvP014]MBP2531871.1 stage V sporulation protein SpoVS [Rhizobium sp. PvP099]